MYVNVVRHQKSHIIFIQIYFGTAFFRQRMCVKDTCYKFAVQKSLKLTRGIK